MSRYVLLDAMGVLYKSCDDVADILVPFVRRNGGILDAVKIRQRYIDCSLGRFSSQDLWAQLGVSPWEGIDDEYVLGHQLSDGALDFLDSMDALSIRVGCLSNDVAEWSRKLRCLFRIEGRLNPWIISADYGVRKPDCNIFFTAIKALNLPASEVVFVDDNATNVAAARNCGLTAVHFIQNCTPCSACALHVQDFQELATWIAKSTLSAKKRG